MARPKKERVICSAPKHRHFAPIIQSHSESIVLQADEFEVLRLHDLEHFSQAEVAAQMLVSRPTVALLLAGAHQKLADAIVNGKSLTVESFDCQICEIGAGCPAEKKASCQRKHRCAASCRREQEAQSKN